MLSPIPRRNHRVLGSLSSPLAAAFPVVVAGRLPHRTFRGLLGVHSRYGLHTRQITFMTLYIGGFRRFVASAPAPIATGWSESCRAGFAPTERPCLRTAHTTFCPVLPVVFTRFFCSLAIVPRKRHEARRAVAVGPLHGATKAAQRPRRRVNSERESERYRMAETTGSGSPQRGRVARGLPSGRFAKFLTK